MNCIRWLVFFTFISALSCGPTDDGSDPFRGPIDGNGLDVKFRSITCDGRSCYTLQDGYAKGKPFSFFNFGSVQTSVLGTVKAADLPAAYVIDSCSDIGNFDPLTSGIDTRVQYPILSSLPLAAKSGSPPVLPFYRAVGAATGLSYRCNDAKVASSIATSSSGIYPGTGTGKYGLTVTNPISVVMWPVIDPSTFITVPTGYDLSIKHFAWYQGLIAAYLDGGQVPVNGNGELQTMIGVVLDPSAPATTFAKGTEPKVVLVSHTPGEAGYSPLVQLHSFRLPAGKAPGDFTGICFSGSVCGAQDVDYSLADANAFNTVFIVAQ